MADALNIRADPEQIERWRLAARVRGLTMAGWMRQIADEECERQAALVLYRIRHERPHEINALVEEMLRQRALAQCSKRKQHLVGIQCDECGLIPYPLTELHERTDVSE